MKCFAANYDPSGGAKGLLRKRERYRRGWFFLRKGWGGKNAEVFLAFR